jgi:hypothetical protein
MDLRAITDLEGGRLQSGKLFGPVGPAISHQFQVWRAIANRLCCGSTSLSHARCPHWHIGPFKLSASLSPLLAAPQQRNADQLFLSTDAGSQSEPWDPGLSVTRRQVTTQTPAAPAPPPSAPADGRHYTLTRHKDRGDVMSRVSKGKRSDAAGHPVVTPDHVRKQDDLPFVPHHASPDPPVHHPSDPHTTQPAHLSGGHAASRATHIVPHPVR